MAFYALLLVAPAAHAADPGPEATDARALAMGGAYRSVAESCAAARFNPAALSVHRGFYAGAAYATRGSDNLDAFQVTLVDNVTSLMGGALQYLHSLGESEREEISLSLSAGHGALSSGLWWGFTGRYVQGRSRGAAEWEDLFTADVGFLFERPGGIRIAVVGYDVLDTSSELLSRRVALGASRIAPQGWTVAADVVRNLDQDMADGVDLHLGGEVPLWHSGWSVRGGYQWQGQSGRDYGSLGVGWSREGSWSVAYAVQRSRQTSPVETLSVFSAEVTF